jgi:hypothetical protein
MTFLEDFSQDDVVLVDDRYYSSRDDKAVDADKDVTPKLFPREKREVVGFVVASVALSLVASGGTGGGGIVVRIYIVVIGLSIQAAIPIGAYTYLHCSYRPFHSSSNTYWFIYVFGGALACTSLNRSRRHPLADRVLRLGCNSCYGTVDARGHITRDALASITD